MSEWTRQKFEPLTLLNPWIDFYNIWLPTHLPDELSGTDQLID